MDYCDRDPAGCVHQGRPVVQDQAAHTLSAYHAGAADDGSHDGLAVAHACRHASEPASARSMSRIRSARSADVLKALDAAVDAEPSLLLPVNDALQRLPLTVDQRRSAVDLSLIHI